MKSKLTTEMKVSEAFRLAIPSVIATKSAFISLCAEIDRDFRVDCDILISQKCTNEKYEIIQNKAPLLKKMPYELFEEYMRFYREVRSITAHLYARNNIKISDNLIKYFTSIVKPQHSIALDNEVTIYGMAYLLTFISKRHYAWMFFTHLFKISYFSDVKSPDSVEMYKYLSDYVMPGKIHSENENLQEGDVNSLNSLILRNITSIAFEIEKAALDNDLKSRGQASTFTNEINRLQEVNQQDIRTLRNAFFHGYYLFDRFKPPYESEIVITFDYIINILKTLKNNIANIEKYKYLAKSIEYFGMDLLNYFYAHMLEISYKILDKRLLTADKVESRPIGTISTFSRVKYYSDLYLPYTCELLPNEVSISLQRNKFTHVDERITTSDNFKIIVFENEKGFDIGQFHTNVTKMYLSPVDLPKKFENKINNQYIKDIKINKIKDFCRLISLYSADI